MSEQQQPERIVDMSVFGSDRPRFNRLIGWRQLLFILTVLLMSFFAFGPLLRTKYPLQPYGEPEYLFFFVFFGLLPGVVILMFWGLIWMWKSRMYALIAVVGVSLSLYAIVLMLFTRPSMSPEASRRLQCRNNLKQLGLALFNYQIDYGTFPPAYLVDEHGKPMHSWRVLILPYIDRKNVYLKYNFDEPWDGPANRELARNMPPVYRCPSHYGSIIRDQQHETITTTYHAVVDSKTMWLGKNGVSVDEITDGLSNTISVIELDQVETNWMDPRPLTVEEFLELYKTTIDDLPHAGGTHALYADGAVRFFSWNMSTEYWRSLLTKSSNDTLPESAMGDPERARRLSAFRWKNWRSEAQKYSTIAFVILALLPLPWVWLAPWRKG